MNPQRFVLFLLVASAALNCVAGQCILNYETDFDIEKPQPVFMTNGEYMVPDTTGTIEIPTGKDIVIGCPGNFVDLVSSDGQRMPILDEWVAKCVNGKTFKAFQMEFNISAISCKSLPEVTINNMYRQCANNPKAAKYRVGYRIQGNFYPLYEVCFDTDMLTTSYVKHMVYPYSALKTPNYLHSFETSGMFESVPMNEIYTRPYQKTTFDYIFGKTQTYTTHRTLEACQLASSSDYVMGSHVQATYQYINTDPIWANVNILAWSYLESLIRLHVKDSQTTVTVYTGTFQTLGLPKPNQPPYGVYLVIGPNKKRINVPQYFYKVVDEPGQPKSVYVSINWDSTSNIDVNRLRFCDDPCTLNWDTGFGALSFCCYYDNFIAQLGYKPF